MITKALVQINRLAIVSDETEPVLLVGGKMKGLDPSQVDTIIGFVWNKHIEAQEKDTRIEGMEKDSEAIMALNASLQERIKSLLEQATDPTFR